MHMKMCIHYLLLRRLASYKVCLCFIVLSVTVCTVGYVCLFCGDQIFVYFVSFLSMIIYEVLYTWCLRYNICSAWFLDIRISTCSACNLPWSLKLASITLSCILYLQQKFWLKTLSFVVDQISSSRIYHLFFPYALWDKYHQTPILFMVILFSK